MKSDQPLYCVMCGVRLPEGKYGMCEDCRERLKREHRWSER